MRIEPSVESASQSEDAAALNEEPRTPSRRGALRAALGAAATAMGPLGSAAHSTTGTVKPDRAPRDRIQFLLNRITMGFTLEEYALAKGLGYEAYLEYQLDHLAIDDSTLDLRLQSLPTLTMTSKQLFDTYVAGGGNQSVPVLELKQAATLRAIHSKRQLFERMVEFWTDHFNVDHRDGPVSVLKTADDRDVIRQHALGTFPELLRANAHSGAMLVYLDNFTNVASAPQENYSRELMELHTLSVSGPYTESDVKEVARCLTGWTIWRQNFPNYGDFRFRLQDHDQGAKTVLGVFIPAGGGESDGDTVLDILATHPSTAEHVSRKMIHWLLTESPPQSLVDAVVNTYMTTGGNIKDMIRTILDPSSLVQLDEWAPPRFRRPFHLFTSVMRAFSLDFTAFARVLNVLSGLGQVPFAWPAPNGYPDSIGAWGSNLLPRWAMAADIFDNQITGITVSPQAVLQRLNATGVQPVSQQINVALTGGALSSEDVNRVQAFIDSQPVMNWQVLREAIALSAASPSFNFY